MERPPQTKATFFLEEHPENLGPGDQRYLALYRTLTPETRQFLEERGWGVAIATIDLDYPTALLIKSINHDFPHLPVSAWIVTSDQNGYWANRFNVPKVAERVEEVKAWANRYDLNLDAFGFDMEIPIQNFRGIMTSGSPIIGLLKEWIKVARSEQYKRQKNLL